MADFLVIPNGGNLGAGQVISGALLTGLAALTAYQIFKLSAPRTFVTSTSGDTPVSIVVDGDSYAISVPAGVSTITIGGVDYEIDTAEILGQPPVILTDPAVDPAEFGAGDTVTYIAAPYVYDPAGGAPVLSFDTRRSGTAVGSGASYVVTDLDAALGFEARQTVVNAHGVSRRSADLLGPAEYLATPLVFTGQQISGPGYFDGLTGQQLMVATFGLADRATEAQPMYSGRGGSDENARINMTSGHVQLWTKTNVDASTREVIFSGNNNLIYPANATTRADKITFITSLGTAVARQVALINGVLVAQAEKSTRAPYSWPSSTLFRVGASNLTFDLYDLRIWSGAEAVDDYDIREADVCGLFVAADGDVRSPDLANGVFGVPLIQLPTDPAQANALVNLGTGADFTGITGGAF